MVSTRTSASAPTYVFVVSQRQKTKKKTNHAYKKTGCTIHKYNERTHTHSLAGISSYVRVDREIRLTRFALPFGIFNNESVMPSEWKHTTQQRWKRKNRHPNLLSKTMVSLQFQVAYLLVCAELFVQVNLGIGAQTQHRHIGDTRIYTLASHHITNRFLSWK